MFKIRKPLDYCLVTQPFGVNYANFYQDLGLAGHNGIDFRCFEDPIYACFDGTITYAGKYDDGGVGIEMISDYQDGERFKAIYYHLKSINDGIKTGEHVLYGQPMGISDNTGKYTTGNHLHFGIKRCDQAGNTLNYNNGYKGAIDPTPYLIEGFYDLPIHQRYGEAKSLTDEMLVKIKYKTDSEKTNAIVYGGWDYTEAINVSLKPIWAFLTKQEYLSGKKPPFKLIM